ncbi:MAG: hypothetical protein ACI8W0_000812 [Flavobacterium sp.]|jgi:hypothetical protein
MKIPFNDKHQGLYNALTVILPYLFIVASLQVLAAYFSGYDYIHRDNLPPTSLQTLFPLLRRL